MTTPTLDKLHTFFAVRRAGAPSAVAAAPVARAVAAPSPEVGPVATVPSAERRPVSPFDVAKAARQRSLAWARHSAEAKLRAPVPKRVVEPARPATSRHASAFARLVAGLRFGPGPDAGPQMSARAMARFQRDPFVQRLARLH